MTLSRIPPRGTTPRQTPSDKTRRVASSYSRKSRRLTRAKALVSYDGTTTRSNVMNTIIYIVGLIVVIGFVLSFFGLR